MKKRAEAFMLSTPNNEGRSAFASPRLDRTCVSGALRILFAPEGFWGWLGGLDGHSA